MQPLRQGVRLTVLFDDVCYASPLKTPYIYSAETVLEETNIYTRATPSFPTMLSSMNVWSSSTRKDSQDQSLEYLIKATKTSPADVIVIYSSSQHPTDLKDIWWSTASAFFNAHRYNRRGSYAHILSRMKANVPSGLTISPRLSCSHPLGMCDLGWK